ncbi:MAG TPA: serine/threonine-protein kinase, partial [Polyangiaceae bacterium]|nr:serine/threonine-protein kinase [Polyangiaceae bacterium]
RAKQLGSYRLVERLGSGGMGEVWRAEHRLLARRAAIKLIRQDDTDGDLAHAQERFRREARSLASLRSRNTIEIYDYGVADDGTFFYVMELLDGLDLESLVKHYGPQPAERVVAILIQACRSLAEAHDAGMVHRDIKPANLFLCRAADEVDLIKVLDFGLVKSVQQTNSSAGLETLAPGQGSQPRLLTSRAHLTQLDAITGTPDYMAPEQITGEIIDRRADLYALGCIGYWLLSGRTLFPGRALLQVLMGHLHDTPPSLASLIDPPPPPALIELLDDCLQKSPQARPPHARVVLERLQRIQFAPGQAFGAEQATAWWAAYQPIRIAEAHDPTHELSDQSRALLRSRMAEIPPTSATS